MQADSYAQTMKILDANAAVDKEWEKAKSLSELQEQKVKSKKEVMEQAQSGCESVHFASHMDLCHLRKPEPEPKFQKYRGHLVLRGDAVKDDSGAYVVFTEHGSSASQMTAAQVPGVMSRLQGCEGHESDAVSVYTHVKMKDAPKLLKHPKSECPTIRIRPPTSDTN